MDFREALVFFTKNMPHVDCTLEGWIDLADALVLASSTPTTPDEWAEQIFDPTIHRDRKIQFIKDVRAASQCSLVDAKNAVEKVLDKDSMTKLREKLLSRNVSTATYSQYVPEDAADSDIEERAYAESRERMSEQGTWFGTPGPMDEEPF